MPPTSSISNGLRTSFGVHSSCPSRIARTTARQTWQCVKPTGTSLSRAYTEALSVQPHVYPQTARVFSANTLRPTCAQKCRPFSTTSPSRAYKTVEEAQSRYKAGPFSWKAAVLFVFTGCCLVVYFRTEKARLQRKRIADQTKGIGKPKVGGPFSLIDQYGNPFTSEDMKGKYALVYFGFTHCPDICPDELDKMAAMYDLVKQRLGNVMLPIMVTCDPARDTPEVVKEYLKEFHPDFIGLTGGYEDIKATCKAYRVYFSTPPSLKPGQDYIVDHSIYFYIMDPEGDFVECIGRNSSAEEAANIIVDHIKDWTGKVDKTERKIGP